MPFVHPQPPLTSELTAVFDNADATSLTHLGNGRYYDATLGRPLQPSANGGIPVVPQSLNRYAATSLGQVGVAEATNQVINPLLSQIGLSTFTTGIGALQSAYANHLVGYLHLQANGRVLGDAGYQDLFSRVPNTSGRHIRYTSRQQVRQSGGRSYQVSGTNQTVDLAYLESKAKSGWPVTYPSGSPFVPESDTALKRLLRSPLGEFGAGFALDFLLAIPEIISPWQNPFLSNPQRVAQNVVAFGGVLAGAGAGLWVGNLAAASGLGGPATFIAVTSTGVVVYIAWEQLIKPGVSFIATTLGRRDPYQDYRNLIPLGGRQ